MAITRNKQQVRDGYLKDLPEDIQNKIHGIHKIIIDNISSKVDDEHYEDLTKSKWAMSCLEEFKTPLSTKGDVGSVRVYKIGKQYKCMIQVTGHFTNHQYGWIEELLHEIVADTYQEVKPEIRRKFDVTLDNEGARGSSFEGFDVYLSNNQAKMVWDLFDGRKTKVIKESSDEYLDEGFFDIFKKHRKKTSTPTTTPQHVRKTSYVPLTSEQMQLIVDELRKIEESVRTELNPMFSRYPIYGLSVHPMDELDIELEFCDLGNDIIGIEIIDGKPHIDLELTVVGYDQYNFMTALNEEHPDEVNRMKQLGYDVNDRRDWSSIHWCEKICGYDKTLEEICDDMERIVEEKFSFIEEFSFGGDNDSGPYYSGTVDAEYLCKNIDLSNIQETDIREYAEYTLSDDLINYYENYHRLMSYDQYVEEKSHGKLKYDFRLGFDYNTGHSLKIVYSLDDINVDMGGGTYADPKAGYKKSEENLKLRSSSDARDYIKSTIAKKGDLDHASSGQKVLAIVDNKTGERLKSARVIGLYAHAVRSSFNRPELLKQDLEYVQKHHKADEFPEVRVGEIDKASTFKSTKLFKTKMYMDREGYAHNDGVDKFDVAFNSLKHGRGAKLDDINHRRSAIAGAVVYRHPSKRDVRRNTDPDVYTNYKKESALNNPEYNVDMTETQAKRTLRTLSQDIINKVASDKNYKINQYTANIYANIITKNLLPRWCSGYKKLSITLDSYQSFFTFEFKIPTMSQDFVSRFINGHEPMNAFLHRVPEIKIKMSPRIFHTMKDPDDAFNFFRAAVRYYDQKVDNYSKRLMSEAMKLNSSMKHLISTTNLSGIVTYPIQLLFVFDDVHMNNAKTFLLSDDDLKAVNSFIKCIYTKYASPEKEKKKIVEDIKTLVKELRESCDPSDNISALKYLPEAVEQFLYGEYDTSINTVMNKFINEQVDVYEMNNVDPDLRYVREKFGVKKLKRIPTDLVSYISIEAEAIETSNDKMMIASYCLGKLEIVEWYIELLDAGSEKYVVPHNKPYLVNVRTQLLRCYDKIMKTPTRSNKNRPIVSIDYPTGYEG